MKDISRKISENYKTIKGEIKDEFEIEKSIFITNMKYVESEIEALSFIEKIKEKYKDDFTIGEDGVPVFKAGRKMITMALKFQKHE